MSEFINNINRTALDKLNTLSAIRMDKQNHDQYTAEIGHSTYWGICREIPVVFDENATGIEYDENYCNQK